MSVRSPKINSLLRVLRTARYLRGSQVAYRLRRIASHKLAWNVRSAVSNLSNSRDLVTPTAEFPTVPEFLHGYSDGTAILEELDRGGLGLVNRTLPFSVDSPDWRLEPQYQDRLWAITLHYHAWLYQLSTLIRADHHLAPQADRVLRSLLADWLRVCGFDGRSRDSLAWNSYAIATRAAWWTRLWHGLGPDFWNRHSDLADQFLSSMYAQAIYLETHLEWDLRANHLLRDAVGLAWLGRFFAGHQPTRWLRTATRVAMQQAREQVLPDGGHFERSPMYHLEVMCDFRELAALLRDTEAQRLMTETWQRMAKFASWMSHPDGELPQFNDSGRRPIAETLQSLRDAGDDVPQTAARGGRFFGDFGMAVWHGGPWTLFFDVGAVGPDYQPGHAHADTLSIECSFRGERLFIDPGCHSYDNDEQRAYDRSTAAHNTVSIDGQNSSEVWHIFRVGRRARPIDVEAVIGQDLFAVTAAHTGFDHLPGNPRHTRSVQVDRPGRLRLVDNVAGLGRHTVSGGFLVAPQWSVEPVSGGWRLSSAASSLNVRLTTDADVRLNVARREWHPDYGVELQTNRLEWTCRGDLPVRVIVEITPSEESAA